MSRVFTRRSSYRLIPACDATKRAGPDGLEREQAGFRATLPHAELFREFGHLYPLDSSLVRRRPGAQQPLLRDLVGAAAAVNAAQRELESTWALELVVIWRSSSLVPALLRTSVA